MAIRQQWVSRVLMVLAVLVCGYRVQQARHAFDNHPDMAPEYHRADGNGGHTTIDFAGQWLMGRVVVLGHPDALYDRHRLGSIVRSAFPREDTSPFVQRRNFPRQAEDVGRPASEFRHDDEGLMYWLMGRDSPSWNPLAECVALSLQPDPWAALGGTLVGQTRLAPQWLADVSAKSVGGALYPPVHGFLMAPLGLFAEPRTAYRVWQWVLMVLTVIAAWGLWELGQRQWCFGGVWLVILLYPGLRASWELGQNPALTLAIVTWSAVLRQKGWSVAGGLLCGWLAFKPSWWLAFALLPVFLRDWRFFWAMVGSSVVLCLATVPVVGVQTWFDWLAVGREANDVYRVNRNWLSLSRDLFGLPARLLLDFSQPEPERFHPAVLPVGWAAWGIIFAVSWRTIPRMMDHTIALALAWLSVYLLCYRFIYYDAVLSVGPLVLLASRPRSRLSRPLCGVLVALILVEGLLTRSRWLASIDESLPLDTILLLMTWLGLMLAAPVLGHKWLCSRDSS